LQTPKARRPLLHRKPKPMRESSATQEPIARKGNRQAQWPKHLRKNPCAPPRSRTRHPGEGSPLGHSEATTNPVGNEERSTRSQRDSCPAERVAWVLWNRHLRSGRKKVPSARRRPFGRSATAPGIVLAWSRARGRVSRAGPCYVSVWPNATRRFSVPPSGGSRRPTAGFLPFTGLPIHETSGRVSRPDAGDGHRKPWLWLPETIGHDDDFARQRTSLSQGVLFLKTMGFCSLRQGESPADRHP
jgi:hypothetical protein